MLPIRKIVLDTNFLMIPGLEGVDIFSEIERICDFPYRLYIIDKTVSELYNIIEKQKGKHKAAAKLALSLIKSKDLNIMTLKSARDVDNLLLSLKDECIIATQDKELKKKIGKNLIVLRSKHCLKLL